MAPRLRRFYSEISGELIELFGPVTSLRPFVLEIETEGLISNPGIKPQYLRDSVVAKKKKKNRERSTHKHGREKTSGKRLAEPSRCNRITTDWTFFTLLWYTFRVEVSRQKHVLPTSHRCTVRGRTFFFFSSKTLS